MGAGASGLPISLQAIARSLVESTPLLLNVFLFLLFFILIFAILGVRLFQGSLSRHCIVDETSTLPEQVERLPSR